MSKIEYLPKHALVVVKGDAMSLVHFCVARETESGHARTACGAYFTVEPPFSAPHLNYFLGVVVKDRAIDCLCCLVNMEDW